MGLEAFAAAGIYDPTAPGAADRAALLEQLVARFGEASVLDAAARMPLFTVVVELSDPRPTRVSAQAVAEATGATLEEVALVRAALGFPVADPMAPEVPDFSTEDVALALGAFELFGRDRTLAFIRVVGSSSQRVAEAARTLFASSITEDAGDAGPSELEMSQANEVAWASWRSLPTVVAHAMLEWGDSSQGLLSEILAGTLTRAIAFVDLVGSTAWLTTAEPVLQARALARFEQAAWDIATRAGGRLVKLIGDEAMLVADDAGTACAIASALVSLAASDPDLPEARAGVAVGEVVARAGDYFGQTVNLAARLVTLAPPSGVLTTTVVARSLDPGGWSAESLGAVELRGLPDAVELSRVRAAPGHPG